MPWTKISAILGINAKKPLFSWDSGDTAGERIYQTLLKNPAIHENAEIAANFRASGKVVEFKKGDEIISLGADDDDVYFLLAGEAKIAFKGQKPAIRIAPNQIGEMAAIDPGKPRSATVKCHSDRAVALKVSGSVFYDIWRNNSQFKEHLQHELSRRHRERIDAPQNDMRSTTFTWLALSIGIGMLVAALIWFFLLPPDWSQTLRVIATAVGGLVALAVTIANNPIFFWRRCFLFTLTALVAGNLVNFRGAVDTGVSDGQPRFNALWEAIKTDWMTSLLLVVVLVLCAVMDHQTRKG